MLRLTILLIVFIAGLAMAFSGPSLGAHAKGLLLLSQQFPQSPVKPLHLLTPPATHSKVDIRAPGYKVNADLLVPGLWFGEHAQQTLPAVILAFGVKTPEKDRPRVLEFADSFARLGFVVLWPRHEVLERGESLLEEPETFVRAFEFLEANGLVNPEKISFVGFSVGSSIATVAASDPRIAQRVNVLFFFGGYYDIFEYVISLATKSALANGELIKWNPTDDARKQAKEVLANTGGADVLKVLEHESRPEAKKALNEVGERTLAALREKSPAARLSGIRASVFILHDRQDPYVPYTEARALAEALPQARVKGVAIVGGLDHVLPRDELSMEVLKEIMAIYGLVHAAFRYL